MSSTSSINKGIDELFEKKPDSEFESAKNYEHFPEVFKKIVEKRDGFKTTPEQETQLAELTSGKKWKYGVKLNTYLADREGIEVFRVWRVPAREGAGAGGFRRQPSIAPLQIDFEQAEVEHAKYLLQSNENRKDDTVYWEYTGNSFLMPNGKIENLMVKKKRISQ